MLMHKFKLGDNSEYLAEDFIDGYLVNPLFLNGSVPKSPFIIRTAHNFSVHCLIDGCLKCCGVFDNLDQALCSAKKSGPFGIGRFKNNELSHPEWEWDFCNSLKALSKLH
jgi:hypothetical protein